MPSCGFFAIHDHRPSERRLAAVGRGKGRGYTKPVLRRGKRKRR